MSSRFPKDVSNLHVRSSCRAAHLYRTVYYFSSSLCIPPVKLTSCDFAKHKQEHVNLSSVAPSPSFPFELVKTSGANASPSEQFRGDTGSRFVRDKCYCATSAGRTRGIQGLDQRYFSICVRLKWPSAPRLLCLDVRHCSYFSACVGDRLQISRVCALTVCVKAEGKQRLLTLGCPSHHSFCSVIVSFIPALFGGGGRFAGRIPARIPAHDGMNEQQTVKTWRKHFLQYFIDEPVGSNMQFMCF